MDIVRKIKESLWDDYIIVNDVFARAVEELKSVLIAGKCRTERVLENVSELFDI
jgi:guanylate kinase